MHMLTVAAARLEHDHANPLLVKALRDAANELATARAEGRGWSKKDAARVECQRAAFYRAKSAQEIRDLMLQRAYDLMWDGDGGACDALIEFLPEADVDRMFNAWENDQHGKEPKSEFYEGKAA
jgi:hypothetical protein